MMAEKTGEQISWGYGAYGYGGAFLGSGCNAVMRTASGDAILPPIAALLGSGALEGRNAYAGADIAGWGFGNSLNGYGAPMPGTFATYDLMLAHPTIALAYAAVTLPVLAAGWKFTDDETKAPKGAKELVAKVFGKVRTELLLQMLRAVAVGFQAFEVVWDKDEDGFTVPVWFKPLLPERTNAVTEKGGKLIGLEQGEKITEPGTWLWFALDVKGTNWHGRGRLENCRRQWCNWLADDDQGYRLSQKAAGIVPYVGYPGQSESDADLIAAGKQTNQQIALGVARALQRMQPVAYRNLSAFDMENIANNAALAGKSLWSVDLLDMGDTGTGQSALTDKLAYRDKLLVRGMGRSERSVIEADTAGSRADAEAHTASIADTDTDTIHALAVAALNVQVVNALLIQNWGPSAKGTVRIESVPVVDERKVMVNKFVDAMNGDPMLRAIAFQQIDFLKLLEETGLKMLDNAPPIDVEEITTQGDEQAQDDTKAAA